jgi:hypothetical protein
MGAFDDMPSTSNTAVKRVSVFADMPSAVSAKPPKTDKPSFAKEVIGQTAKDVWQGVKATPEVAYQLGAGAVAPIAGGLAGLGKWIGTGNVEEAAKTQEAVNKSIMEYPTKLTGRDYTETAKGSMEQVGKVMEIPGKAGRAVGDLVPDKYPNIQAGVATGIEAGLFFLAPTLAKKGWVKSKGKIVNTKTNKVMPPDEVAKNVEEGNIVVENKPPEAVAEVKPEVAPEPIKTESAFKDMPSEVVEEAKPVEPIAEKPTPTPTESKSAFSDMPSEVVEQPKQPWEMTKKEFDNNAIYQGETNVTRGKTGWWTPDKNYAKNMATEYTKIGRGGENPTISISFKNEIPDDLYTRQLDNGTEVIPKEEFWKQKNQIDLGDNKIKKHGTFSPDSVDDIHKIIVKQALTEGKPVPPEVLKDYPVLKTSSPEAGQAPVEQYGKVNLGQKGGGIKVEPTAISITNKSVRDLPQQIKIKDGNITVISKFGKRKLGEYTFNISEWEQATKGPSANSNWNYNQLISKKFRESGNLDTSPEGEAITSRILNAQVMGIKDALKQYGERSKKAQGDLYKLAQEQKQQLQTGAITLPYKESPTSPKVTFSPEVEKAYQGSIIKPESISLKVKDTFEAIWHKTTREFEYLPKGKQFSEARFAIKQLEKQKGIAKEKAITSIGETLSGLDKNEYDTFTRKVILNDLINEAESGHELPWGLTKETLPTELSKVDAVVGSSPKVQESIAKRQAMWSDLKTRYSKAMDDIGFDVKERIQNENYFRHQVLEYVNIKGIYGTGKKLRTPTSRGFLKQRKGSSLDINRDYLQSETEVMAQMEYDVRVAETIKRIDKHYNIADTVRRSAKNKGVENWREEIPDGYTTWQPREGNSFFLADSVPAKLAEKLKTGALEELGITAEDLKQVLSMGGKRKELVIPEELAATLDELTKQQTTNVLANADRVILKGWKVWTLISPRRWFKYNLRNVTGDADAAFVGNPSGFKKTPQATKELYDVIIDKKTMTQEMQDWYDRGGMQSTLQAQEMGELKNLWMFKRLYEPTKGIKDLPNELWKKYWRGARISTDMREAVLRYANYLDYLEQIKKSPEGKPNNFGASIPEEIMGLSNPKDRAFWLSNDLLGAYDRVSVMGQNLREYWVPFWSWKEVNFKRYIQFAKNAVNDGKFTELVGRKATATAIKSPYIAYRTGSFLVKATALWSALQVWNNTRFPEEEKQLGVEERSKPHVILGKDENGKVISFNRLGALGDFLEWFGLDTAPHYVDAWFNGKMTLKDIAKDMAKSPVNVLSSIITPFVKTPAELATRKSLYPDVTRPGNIRDRGLYLARNLGLENEYIAITGKPSEGYKKSLTKVFVYSTDPGQVAYSAIFDLKNEFLKKNGKGAEGFWLTPRGNALYNLKLAMRYKDKEATDKYLVEYFSLGGTQKGLKRSLDGMHPLSGMSQADKDSFVLSLNDDDRATLQKAINFYSNTLLGNNKEER